MSFVDYYKFPIKENSSIVIGTGDEDGENTYLTNRLAVENHLLLTLDSSDSEYIGTLELLTNKRKAIVNSTLLRNRSETEDSITQQLQLSSLQHDNNSIFINKIKVKSGDFIRIGFSNYKIYREDDSIILDNISLSPFSFTNLFYLYTTTTYPDIVIGDKTGVEKSSLFWLWFTTSTIFLIFSYILFFISTKITKYTKRIQWAIVHPILYFILYWSFYF